MRLTTIVGGGQTGADRGGQDAAIELDLGRGGWAPSGWLAEDGEIPAIYRDRMRESSSANYGVRTRLNIQDSDGTLIVSFAERPDGGTKYTIEQCERMDKAHIHVVLPRGGRTQMPDAVAAGIREWLDKAHITVLNVAGPRESKEPGIQEAVRDLLVWVLEDEIEVPDVEPTRAEIWQGVFGAAAPRPYAPGEKMTDRHPDSVIAQVVEETIVEHAARINPDRAEAALDAGLKVEVIDSWHVGPNSERVVLMFDDATTSLPVAAGASDAGGGAHPSSPDAVSPAAAPVAIGNGEFTDCDCPSHKDQHGNVTYRPSTP